MRRSCHVFKLLSLGLVVVLTYQACGDFVPTSLDKLANPDLLVAKGCDDILIDEFERGFHSFTRRDSTCLACHSTGSFAPAFASQSLSFAFQVFSDIGAEAISKNAVSPTHNPPFTGSQNEPEVGELKEKWNLAVAEFNQCQDNDSVPDLVTVPPVTTVSKTDPTIATASGTVWKTLTWTLDTETIPLRGDLPVQISVEIQTALINGATVGYALRNPKGNVTSGQSKYRIKGFYILFNDDLFEDATTYRNMNAVVCPGAPVNLALSGNSQLMVIDKNQADDRFALEFTSIETLTPEESQTAVCGFTVEEAPTEPVAPANVTFTQLVSTDPKLGIFKSNCFSCHQGGTASGGLDLSSYGAAKAAAATILRRVNDSTNPMPTSGLMDPYSRSVVESWVNAGMPQ